MVQFKLNDRNAVAQMWRVNGDGSISPEGASHMALGLSKSTSAAATKSNKPDKSISKTSGSKRSSSQKLDAAMLKRELVLVDRHLNEKRVLFFTQLLPADADVNFGAEEAGSNQGSHQGTPVMPMKTPLTNGTNGASAALSKPTPKNSPPAPLKQPSASSPAPLSATNGNGTKPEQKTSSGNMHRSTTPRTAPSKRDRILVQSLRPHSGSNVSVTNIVLYLILVYVVLCVVASGPVLSVALKATVFSYAFLGICGEIHEFRQQTIRQYFSSKYNSLLSTGAGGHFKILV